MRSFFVLPLTLLACTAAPDGRDQASSDQASALVSSGACPAFHCSPEATGAMSLPLETSTYPVLTVTNKGAMRGQGCSGDGSILACVYGKDATGTGILKVFNPTAAGGPQELWGSAGAPIVLSNNAGIGQVPYLADDGDVFVSDDRNVLHFSRTGTYLGNVALSQSVGAASFGIIGIDGNRSFVNQKNGRLTVFDRATHASYGGQVTGPGGVKLNLSSPASAHGARAYLVTTEGAGALGNGYLRAIDFGAAALADGWTYPFQGGSGASAIIVSPEISGDSAPLVVFHVPALAGGTTRDDHLVAVRDAGIAAGGTATAAWTIALPAPMDVAPVVDRIQKQMYFHLRNGFLLYARGFDGSDGGAHDIRQMALAAGRTDFADVELNGHVVGTFTDTEQTVLLSAKGSAGQFVFGVDPKAWAIRWVKKIGAGDNYTAAWTIQARPNGNCPIVVGVPSGINVLCPR